MNIFWLSKYCSFNILLYFSLFANILYIFYAIYLFKIKIFNGLLCVIDAFIYSWFYYFICIIVVCFLAVILLIERFLYKLNKLQNNHVVLEKSNLKSFIFSICIFCFVLLFLVFFTISTLLLNISSHID